MIAPSPFTPEPETVMGLLPVNWPPPRSKVELLVIVMEATELKLLLPAYTKPPVIVAGPVKLPGLTMVNLLEPALTRLPAPLVVPEPLKL